MSANNITAQVSLNIHGGKSSHVTVLGTIPAGTTVTKVTSKATGGTTAHEWDYEMKDPPPTTQTDHIHIRLKGYKTKAKELDGGVTTGDLSITLSTGDTPTVPNVILLDNPNG